MKLTGRVVRQILIILTLGGLGGGLAAMLAGHPEIARAAWIVATSPVLAALSFAIIRDLYSGRMGVDILALLSMSVALALDQALAGAIVAVMYAGGQALEDFAIGRAERSLKELVDRAPHLAHRKEREGLTDLPIDQVAVGDELLVRAGEVIPLDGQIISVAALVDESVLTGEPIPVMRQHGEPVNSGTINAGEAFEMRTTATAENSAYAGIVRLVTAAQTTKSPFIRVADRYALLLIPFTLSMTAFAWWLSRDPTRALAVLVTATPCPLILAAPVAFIGGTSLAARRGILIKGSGPLEMLAKIRTVMFDKTGTLTVGGARLITIETATGVSPDDALRLAASLEQASHHVLAATIVSVAREKGLTLHTPTDVHELLGSGLEGVIEGHKIGVGSIEFVHGEGRLEEWALRAARRASWRSALTVFVAVDGNVIAVLLFADELRRETPRAIQALRSVGIDKIVMVTGDRAEPAETIGAALDLDSVLAERVPSDKVDAVTTERRLAPTLMVGDGINDAPALAAANVGLAMGARGASASSEAADAVILVDRVDRVAEAVLIARRTRRIAIQSIVVGMGLSGVAMLGATFGYVSPIAGALIQEIIDAAVILNALRALVPPSAFNRPPMSDTAASILRDDHQRLESSLERLRQIADALDVAKSTEAVVLIHEANQVIESAIVKHEREDESLIYPRVSAYLKDNHGLSAMSRAHREILHQARLLSRLSDGLRPAEAEPYLIRDAQRIIESIESLVHIHNAQEEDIYEHAAEMLTLDSSVSSNGKTLNYDRPGLKALERALGHSSESGSRQLVFAGLATILTLMATGIYWGQSYIRSIDLPNITKDNKWEKITAIGVIKDTTVTVEATISGMVEAIHCDIGSYVKIGQLCADIDSRPYRSLLDRRKADLKRSLIELSDIQISLTEASRQLKLSQIAKKRVNSHRIEKIRKAYEQQQDNFKRAELSVAAARAAMGDAEKNLELTRILSPVDGKVVSRDISIGQTLLEATSTPLFTIAPVMNGIQIVIKADDPLTDKLKVGSLVLVTMPTNPDLNFEGKINSITLQENATELTLSLNSSNSETSQGILRPGAAVVIEMKQ